MATGDKKPVVMAADRDVANGVATLGADAKLNDSQIPMQKIMAVTNAAEYSQTQTYVLGAYCTRGGKLYRCTTAISAAEVWTDAHWTETTVGAELIAIYTALQNKANATVAEQHNFPLISSYTSPNGLKYSKDELGLVVIQGNLYKADGLSAGHNQIGTMPSGFRPSFQSHSPVFINVGYVTPSVGELYIKQDNGYTEIYVPKAITGEVNIAINACYVAGNY